MSSTDEFIKGLWRENPVFVQLLGLCPALAVTNSAINGLAMGAATTFVLVGSSLLTAGYVFRVLELLYARPVPDATRVRPLGAGMLLPIVVLALATLALGFANAFLVDDLLAPALPAGLALTVH